GCVEQVERIEQWMAVPLGAWRNACIRVLIDGAFAKSNHGVVHGNVHELPFARLIRLPHRGQYAQRELGAWEYVADSGTRLDRQAIFGPCYAQVAAHGLSDYVV